MIDSSPLNQPVTPTISRPAPARWDLSPVLQRPMLLVGAGILLFMVGASLLAPFIAPYDPVIQDLSNTLKPPSSAHLFGTDNFGRDIFSRVLYATKLDLQIGILCVLFPWIIGVALGSLSGYFGGWIDTVIMRTVDIFTAFPFLIIVIGIIAILGPGLTSMYIALTLAGWSAYARIVRGEILVAKRSEYTLAARAIGYGHARILFRHILPNIVTPALVFSMSDIILVILSTTSLSFLGLGVQPPTPEWGSMIAEGRGFIMTAWWMVTLPGSAIVLAGIGLSLFGDGLADILRAQD